MATRDVAAWLSGKGGAWAGVGLRRKGESKGEKRERE